LNGLGFGFLIPIFLVTSGMAIDPAAVAGEPGTWWPSLPSSSSSGGGLVFLSERISARRVTPTRASSLRESVAVATYAAAGLPIIVAVTSSAVSAGQMTTTNAPVLVAGGAITVLVCPLAATLLLGHDPDADGVAAPMAGYPPPD
jgi:Kef-type K+ transport system membrane component KefB